MTAEHVHVLGPWRCCPDEPAEAVLARLRDPDNAPVRMGYPAGYAVINPAGEREQRGTGWNGESVEDFARRVAAHAAAIAREEEALRRSG